MVARQTKVASEVWPPHSSSSKEVPCKLQSCSVAEGWLAEISFNFGSNFILSPFFDFSLIMATLAS